MKISDIPIFLLIMFTLIYAVIGNPDNETWSACYFIVNYILMFFLFKNEKSKLNRIVGMALSSSIIVFVILRYFFDFIDERYYALIPFFISLYWVFKRETKNG